MKPQPCGSLLRLETTGISQTAIEDEILAPCFTFSISSFVKEEAKSIYMQDYNKLTDKEDIGRTEIYAIATSTEFEHDKRPITASDFINEHMKNLCCRQASPTIVLTGSTFSYDANDV